MTAANVLKAIEQPYPDDIVEILERYPKGRDGYLLELFRVFANSRRFLVNKGVANLLDRDSPLALRQREIVILRVTANTGCEYEWGVHVTIFAGAAELSEEQVRATREGAADASCWSDEERVLIQVVDELCTGSAIGDVTLKDFRAAWDLEQQLEILSLCGNYHTVSFVANAARLDPEPFGARFPDSDSGGTVYREQAL
jgi:alkylhydroperoxidase family enzyme